MGLRWSGKLAFRVERVGKARLVVGFGMQEGKRDRDARIFIVYKCDCAGSVHIFRFTLLILAFNTQANCLLLALFVPPAAPSKKMPHSTPPFFATGSFTPTNRKLQLKIQIKNKP